MGGSTFGLLGSWNGSSRSTSWLSESSLLEALVEAPVEFGDKLLVGQLLNQLSLDGRADLNSDSRKSRPGGGARPGLIGAIDGDRQQGSLAASSERAESGLQRAQFAIVCSRTLGEDQHHLASPQALECLLESLDTRPFAVDGNGVHEENNLLQHRDLKETLAGQEIEAAVHGQSHQNRIEEALMIRADNRASLVGNVLPASNPQAKHEDADKAGKGSQRGVGESARPRPFQRLAAGLLARPLFHVSS